MMVPKRLKVARKYAGLSQEKLGVLSGLDEVSARARISKYEHGTNRPTYELTRQFAKVLDVPTCYFYIDDDEFANQVLALYDKTYNPAMPPRAFY
jgi:transcriptional regulator with XRE-family HTH domain